jgi:hypothetical protein
MHRLPGFGAAGLVGAVVHDGCARVNGVDEGAGVGQVEAVMIDQIEVDGADEIDGADERDLLGLGQVAEIEEAEFSEGDEDAGERGFSVSSRSHLGSVGAQGLGAGLTPGIGGDAFAVGGDNDRVQAGKVDGVAGMDDAAGLAFNGFEVGGVVVCG